MLKKSVSFFIILGLTAITWAGEEEFRQNLKKNIPNLKSISVSDTGIEGIKEVVIDESGEVFYADKTGNNIFIGAWIDETGQNLTKNKMDKLAKINFENNMNTLNKSLGVKIGDGKNEVIEFTDVDCPFCKQAESFFDAKDSDATRYLFFTPIDSLHPLAAKKSVHILCADDRSGEYKRVLAGEDMEFKSCAKGEELLKVHREIGAKLSVQGTPHFFINGVSYSGADPRIYEIIRKK